jgi:UDPglucose 6-dehydrogenase
MRIAMIGRGYAGLVSGACFAEFGSEVAVVESDPAGLKSLHSADMSVVEPGLEDLVAKNVAAGRLFFTNDLTAGLSNVEAIFISVGTHETRRRARVYAGAEHVARSLASYAVIVPKSAVPVGAGD